MATKIAKTIVGKGVSVSHTSHNVLTVYVDDVLEGWEMWFLLTSDRHHDSVECNRDLEREHLEEARRRNAYVLDVGDLFDAMQGRYDPRRSYVGLRPEYKVENYLDEIVADAARFYGEFADRILLLGRGNHESSILKNNGVDLTSNLVHRLNTDYGGHVQAGGYGGWVRVMVSIAKTQRESINIKYLHGAGGANAAVTRGVIQTNRQAVYLPDADVVVNGHNHEAWCVPVPRERITQQGIVYQDLQYHIRTATYKNDYGDGAGNWHVESGKPPKPMGAAWLRLYYSGRRADRPGHTIGIEPILAVI